MIISPIISGFIVIGAFLYLARQNPVVRRFIKLFRNLGLGINDSFPVFIESYPEPINSTIYTTYAFTLPNGLTVEQFANRRAEIEQSCGYVAIIGYEDQRLLIKVSGRRIVINY